MSKSKSNLEAAKLKVDRWVQVSLTSGMWLLCLLREPGISPLVSPLSQQFLSGTSASQCYSSSLFFNSYLFHARFVLVLSFSKMNSYNVSAVAFGT